MVRVAGMARSGPHRNSAGRCTSIVWAAIIKSDCGRQSSRAPACCLPVPHLHRPNTAAVAPASWLRSTWRHVTHVRSPKARHIDCNEHARNLLPWRLVWFCLIAIWRRAAQERRGGLRRPSDGKIKAAVCGPVGGQKNEGRSASCCDVHFDLRCANSEKSSEINLNPHIARRPPAATGEARHHDRLASGVPDRGRPVKARATRDRLRRLTALTGLQLPGSLPPSDHGFP